MKYKVGDKVRVREDLKAGNFYGFYLNKEMAELKGRVVEIEDVYSDSYYKYNILKAIGQRYCMSYKERNYG